MSEAHARLSPSNHRWPKCPGSVREEAAYPDISGEAAIDGTGSHLLLEMCLLNNVRAEAYEGQIIGANHHDKLNGWLIHRDRIDRVQMCLDYVNTRVTQLRKNYPESKVIVEAESKSNPGEAVGRTDWWGTCDITITVLDENGGCFYMEVIDYKDGQGWVNEKDNSQLLGYLFGKLKHYIPFNRDFFKTFVLDRVGGLMTMTIVQPKTSRSIRSQNISPRELIEKIKELTEAARKTDDPNAPLIPDEKGGKGYCTWCKHKPNCPAQGQAGLEVVKTMSNDLITHSDGDFLALADLVLKDVTQLDNEKLTKLADAEPGFQAVFDKAKQEIERRIEEGQTFNGYEMRPGRGSKVWAYDEDEIVKKLKSRRLKTDEIYPKKLASPAQILGLSKLNDEQKQRLEKELIVFKAGKDKLTRVERSNKKLSTQQMFADIPSFVDPEPPAQPEKPAETQAPVSFI